MLSIRYRFLSSQRSYKCELTSHPFWFKRELSVLNMILETLTSFDSVFRDIARSTIDSAIDFGDTSEFKSLVPTCMMKWSTKWNTQLFLCEQMCVANSLGNLSCSGVD